MLYKDHLIEYYGKVLINKHNIEYKTPTSGVRHYTFEFKQKTVFKSDFTWMENEDAVQFYNDKKEISIREIYRAYGIF